MPGAEQQARAGCSPTIVTRWTSDEVPGGLVRETFDQICRDNRYPGTDAVLRRVRETLLESFETAGSTTGPRPIQPVPGIAPILPLHVVATLPDQPPGAAPAATRAAAPTAPVAAAAPASAARTANGATVPAGTVIPVLTSGLVSAATNRPGDRVRGTVLQPVVVNGAVVIPANTTVNLQVVGAAGGLSVQLADLTITGGTIAAGSSEAALDPQVAAANAALERALAAMAASPGGAATQQAMASRLAVVSGPRLNLPSGTRLLFTLTAPIVVAGAETTSPPAPRRIAR